MSLPSNIVGTVFKASQVSEGTVDQTTDPITFTETKALASQKIFGTPLGPNATATVTAVTTDGATGFPNVTVTINNSGTFADGQTITGLVIGNDAGDLVLSGTFFGTLSYIYVTNTDAQQPGVGGTAMIRAEPVAPAYVTPACYCAGTLIRTDRGDRAVETLAIGDTLVTVNGALRAIRWIGRRSYTGRFLTRQTHLLPIRIEAGALADDVPARDLLVSPKHAMLLDGLLVPAELLVNGATIVQERHMSQVDYFHIELDTHDAIWAEGAASETFVDDDSRAMFHNAAEFSAAYPDATVTVAVFCAPRVTDGYELEAVRLRIAQRVRPLAVAC